MSRSALRVLLLLVVASLASNPVRAQEDPPAPPGLEPPPPLPALSVVETLGAAGFSHGSTVTRVVFTPDGRRVVSGAADGTIRTWDLETGKLVSERFGDFPVADLVIPGPGRLTAAGFYHLSCSYAVHAASFTDGEPTATRWREIWWVWCAALDPAGRRLLLGADGTRQGDPPTGILRFLDPETLAEKRSVKTGSAIPACVALAPDGTDWAAGSKDGALLLAGRGGPGRPLLLRGHEDAIRYVAFDAEGRRLLSAGTDGRLLVRDAATGELVSSHLDPEGGIATAAFVPGGGDLLYGREDGALVRLRGGEPEVLAERAASALAVSPDGSRAVAAGGSRLLLLDLATGEEIPVGDPAPTEYTALAPTRDGRSAFAGTAAGEVIVLDIVTGRSLRGRAVLDGAVVDLVPSPSGDRLLVSGPAGTVLLSTADLEPIAAPAELPAPAKKAGWSADGSTLFIRGHTLVVFRPGEEEALARIETPDRYLRVALTADGSHIRILDREEDRFEERSLPGGALARVEDAAEWGWGGEFTPDGARLVSRHYDDLAVRNVSSGKEEGRFHAQTSMFHLGIVVSPDGRHVLSGAGSRWKHIAAWQPAATVVLSDIVDARRLKALDVRKGRPDRLGFLGGGRWAWAVLHDRLSVNRELRVWTAPEGRLVGALRGAGTDWTSVVIATDGARAIARTTDRKIQLLALPE